MRTNVPGSEPFRAGRFAVLRLAAKPAVAASRTHVDLDVDEASAAELSAYLRDLVADPLVREAIEVSSGSLAGTLRKVESGAAVDPAKLRRAVLSATRYVLRMCGRPTPFGLLAGVSLVQLDETARARIGERHVKQVRPDAGWLHAMLVRLRQIPALRERLQLTTNNLCEPRGDRLVLPYMRTDTTDDPPGRQLSVGYTPVVRTAVEAARRPIAYPELRTVLTTEFPEADDTDADRLLGQLIDREILLTDLDARLDLSDQFELVRTRLADVDHPDVAAFRQAGGTIDAYAEAPPGTGRDAWRRAVSELTGLHPTKHPPIHVDLRIDADVRLPRTLVDEVAHVAGVLWRLAPPSDRTPGLGGYQQEFLDKYGPHQVVPVLEVLDPHLGLGPPGGYRQPPAERKPEPKPTDPHTMRRDEALAAALARNGNGELVVDDTLVDRLASAPGDTADLVPDSLDVCVQMFAESAEALTNGDYTLAIAPGGGSLTAGAMCGRFAGMLGADDQLVELFEPPDDTGALGAQLFFQPAQPRSGNVLGAPRVLPHRVPVGCFDDVGDEHVIDIRELAVGTTSERLYLTVPRLGREVRVVRPHMLNVETAAPNLARFLVGVSGSGIRRWAPWLWGRLGVLPNLPRVRYGRTVLAPAQWRPDPELGDRTLTWPEWQRALGNWRDRYGVPDLVRVNVYDNHVELDLSIPLHQRLFRDHLRHYVEVPVWESPVRYGSLGVTGGRCNELVVPVVAARQRPAVPDNPSWHTREAVSLRHQPGGEWLYAKLYLLEDLHDGFLVKQIRQLVERLPATVDRWLFLRYRDPEAQLRLRFHGPADQLHAEALPVLHEWADAAASAGLIRRLVLDAYEPETERYGGAAALPFAEKLFHADSAAVVEQLALRASGKLSLPIETLAAANYVELLDSLGDWDWRQWVLDAFPVELSNQVPAGVRREAVRRIDSERHWGRADAARAYGEALGIETGDVHPSAVMAILHMHANRLIGIDREAERRSYGLLRAAVRKHLDERRHRR